MAAPLEGLTVLDLSTGVAGPYATKLLADCGADVIKVEPPGGDPARCDGPFPGGTPDIEASGRFLFLNTNKRGIVLDLSRPGDRSAFEGLVPHCDAVIEDFAPGHLDALGLGYGRLQALRPGIVLASITPWGQTGPYRDAGYALTDIVAQGMGGPMLWTGRAEREPLRLGGGGALALHQAGAVAALAVTMALLRQEAGDGGDHIDLSVYETQIGSRDRSAPYLANHIYNGTEPQRRASGGMVALGMRPCLDGYTNIAATGARLPGFLRMIGMDELAADPDAVVRARDPEVAGVIEAVYMAWLSERGKREAAEAAQHHHLLAAPVNGIADLPADPHFRDRGAWETIDHPRTGPLEYPARPFRMNSSTPPPATRAPLLDEHRGEVLALGGHQPLARPPLPASSHARRLPLEGVRVADITVVWAGPYATQLLADWGAEVIRIEPINRIQPTTRQAERRTDREQEAVRGALGIATGGSFPDYDPGPDPWNRNSGFNSHARNKLSVSCDITSDEGHTHLLRLIEQCDVVVENNVPETIDRAGAGYEVLRAARPDLIMLRMPAYGLSGPYSGWRALGTHIEGLVGHHQVRAYPGGSPDEGGDVFTADSAAGVQAALAVVMALRHRARTGEGQLIELSQAENFLPMLGELLLDWNMNGNDPGSWGNRHRSHAPHQAYPALGEDAWIAIDVATDEQFVALCRILGCPELAADPRFAQAAGRKRHEAVLDELVGGQTRRFKKFDLFRRLQAVGIAAGPLQTAAERLHCPQLAARGFFEELDHASVGRFPYPGLIWRMADTPNHLRRGPVTLGQDNEYVYRELIGVSEAEFGDLVRRGVAGTTYHPGVVPK
ncbi:MAG: hypothetical protein GEU80_04430 [Dehalococcoidia bacterium]|nr:hypothetical protein [Dehalococcoidia bacterium]